MSWVLSLNYLKKYSMSTYKYFSKWRKEWVKFNPDRIPTQEELIKLKAASYRISTDDVKVNINDLINK